MPHDHRMNSIGDNHITGMRTKRYGWAGETTKGIGENGATHDIKDDPGYTPVEVGSTPATFSSISPAKGYFPVVSKKETGEDDLWGTTTYNDKKRTRWGATRQAKKNLRGGK